MVYEFLLDDRKTNSRLVAICLASILLNVAAFAEQQTPLDKVRTLRLQGKLPEAKSLQNRPAQQHATCRCRTCTHRYGRIFGRAD